MESRFPLSFFLRFMFSAFFGSARFGPVVECMNAFGSRHKRDLHCFPFFPASVRSPRCRTVQFIFSSDLAPLAADTYSIDSLFAILCAFEATLRSLFFQWHETEEK